MSYSSESTPLLGSRDLQSHDATVEPINLSMKPSSTVKKELLYILKNSIPVLITFLFQYFIQIMIPIYFASRLGPDHLSASSLSITTFYISCPVIINGFSTSLDTFCSTAYGAGNFTKVGLYYQRCTLILLFLCIPISLFFLSCGSLILKATKNEELAGLCSQYLRWMPLAAPAIVIFECSKRFLQSQNKFSIPTRITIFAVPLSLYLNSTLMEPLGFNSPPVSFVITYWFMSISLVTYIFTIDGYQCWNPNVNLKDLFQGWLPFIQLGFPGVMMIMSEAFAFQVLTFLSTRFGTLELASQSIVSTLASFAFQLPFSVGICCSTRVANIIGAKSLDYKPAIKAMVGLAFTLSFLNFAWMAIFRFQLAEIFTKDEALIQRVGQMFLVVGFNQLLDCLNVICAAILRGQGRQRIGSFLSIISYYVVATPFEFLFGFYWNMQVLGLWLGLAVGTMSKLSESTSLVSSVEPAHHNTIFSTISNNSEVADDDSSEIIKITTVKDELKYIVTSAFPVLLTFSFQYFVQIMIPIYFSSKLGENYLAACSFSITAFYVTGPVIIDGFSTSMDTFCSTSYGAGNYTKVGLYYQRCTLILLVISIPISVIWLSAKPIIQFVTNNEPLAVLSAQYLRWMPLACPAIVIFECSKHFLQAQNKFSIPTRIIVVAIPIAIYLNTVLAEPLGFDSPPVSFTITYWFMAISLVVYIFAIDGYQCWNPYVTATELFEGWIEFFKLGIPGIMMIMSEALAFDILTFLAVRFGPVEMTAQSIVATLSSFAFQLPFAVGICCSVRTANIIGAKSDGYKVAMKAMIGTACVLCLFNFMWLAGLRYQLARIFTDDPVLIKRVCDVSFIVALAQLVDCMNIVVAGILRGQGRHRIGSILSLICYYTVATPLGICFAFYFNLKVLGLWIGVTIGVFLLSIAELYLVLTSDWQKIIETNSKIVV
ncbi:hypothetical protein CANARDRAFT_6565 [[Candida] arabinofermentans NRRL YB-2248]|uniref:MATE efflux family protein n=1 Tax=[Candida] arabinofermentans NRRL YB-2248 TaxID=983967 RepID=A0A1E4T5J3_9ASCO|nr:hypothetical protein CANARDRAFT_6565 [[Candida] arabinofermentans NRRL YB-2248]